MFHLEWSLAAKKPTSQPEHGQEIRWAAGNVKIPMERMLDITFAIVKSRNMCTKIENKPARSTSNWGRLNN